MEYSFNIYNKMAGAGILMALNAYIGTNEAPPVILCIGSDLAIGDSLGPVCGTMLQNKNCYKGCFVYGTLKKPVTAKEVKYLNAFLKETHPNSKIIAVDAAVGAAGDIGLITINNKGLKPGLGANKKLPAVGDVSIMGIVAEKSLFNYSLIALSTAVAVIHLLLRILHAVRCRCIKHFCLILIHVYLGKLKIIIEIIAAIPRRISRYIALV